MANDPKDPKNNDESTSDLHRRDFVAMSVAAGLAAAGSASGAGMPVVETDVEIKTARWHLRRRFHSPQERFSSRCAHLARRIWIAALHARNGQAPCR